MTGYVGGRKRARQAGESQHQVDCNWPSRRLSSLCSRDSMGGSTLVSLGPMALGTLHGCKSRAVLIAKVRRCDHMDCLLTPIGGPSARNYIGFLA